MQKPVQKIGKILLPAVVLLFAGMTLAEASPSCCGGCGDKKSDTAYSDEVTGSRIKRPYRKIGHTVDGTDSVFIISRQDIDRSGARDVAQAIRKTTAFSR